MASRMQCSLAHNHTCIIRLPAWRQRTVVFITCSFDLCTTPAPALTQRPWRPQLHYVYGTYMAHRRLQLLCPAAHLAVLDSRCDCRLNIRLCETAVESRMPQNWNARVQRLKLWSMAQCV